MHDALAWLWNAVTSISNVITVFSFLWLLYSAFTLWNKRRQYKKRLDLLPKSLGQARPAALAVGLKHSVRGQVEQFIKDQNLNINVIEEVTRDGMVDQKDFPGVLAELNEIKVRLTQIGITELHLFYFGPVTIAAAIGAMVDNWVPTTAYNFVGGTYSADLVISKQTILSA